MPNISLQTFFSPQSIVVIGASENPTKVGNIILKNLCTNNQKEVKIFAVNPHGGYAYTTYFQEKISDLKEIPDIAIIAIPAPFVVKTIEECGKFGIKNIVIISAGFKEIGNITGEKEIIHCAQKYSMNILGPNCLGFLNIHKNINASFASSNGIKKGNIAMVSQSGAMAVAMIDWAKKENLGFSKIITIGNKSHINENDFLEYLANDPETDVIVLYLESIENGKEFFRIASTVSKRKPIIMVKSGISTKGSLAAASHTGALSGKKEVLETALQQSGIHSTHSLQEMFFLSKIFSYFADKKDIPDDIAVITNAGGPAVMTIDNADIFNITLANFSSEEQEILRTNLPKASSCKNPIDILGDATHSRYEQILHNLHTIEEKRKKTFTYLILLTQQSMTDSLVIAKSIQKFQNKYPHSTIITSFMGGEDVTPAREFLKKNNILHYNYPRDALSAYAKLHKQKENRKKREETYSIHHTQNFNSPQISSLLQKEKQEKREMCSLSTVSKLLSMYTIPFAEEVICTSENNLNTVWETLNKHSTESAAFVMKIASRDIPHKSDIGGVLLNIQSKIEAQRAYRTILKNITSAQEDGKIEKTISIDGVSLQKMMNTDAKEVYIGFIRDSIFGDVILVGYGGIYLNIFSDISRRILPLSKNEIHEMLQETKFYALLKGARGEQSINIDVLLSTLYKLSLLFQENTDISSIDINPILSDENESIIVDAKFFL